MPGVAEETNRAIERWGKVPVLCIVPEVKEVIGCACRRTSPPRSRRSIGRRWRVWGARPRAVRAGDDEDANGCSGLQLERPLRALITGAGRGIGLGIAKAAGVGGVCGCDPGFGPASRHKRSRGDRESGRARDRALGGDITNPSLRPGSSATPSGSSAGCISSSTTPPSRAPSTGRGSSATNSSAPCRQPLHAHTVMSGGGADPAEAARGRIVNIGSISSRTGANECSRTP